MAIVCLKVYEDKFGFCYIYHPLVFFKIIIFLEIITYLHLIKLTTMSQTYSMKRIKCADFLDRHRKICFLCTSVRLKQLEDLAHTFKHHYLDLPLIPSTHVCKDCYNRALEVVSSTDNEFTTDYELNNNEVDKDEDFLTSSAEHIEEFNNEINTSFLGSVSPIKTKNLIRKKSIENYVKKKKKKILSTLSNALDVKLNNVYDVSIKANESSPRCCTECVQNIDLERLRLSGRVLDLGLKGRRLESTLHLTEVFF